MNARFKETMIYLSRSKICTLEKKINKKNKNTILMIMMMISHIDPPLYTTPTLHAQNHGLGTMVFVHTVLFVTCTNHGLGTMVLCTRFSMVVSSIICI